jgi:hypothetical protein
LRRTRYSTTGSHGGLAHRGRTIGASFSPKPDRGQFVRRFGGMIHSSGKQWRHWDPRRTGVEGREAGDVPAAARQLEKGDPGERTWKAARPEGPGMPDGAGRKVGATSSRGRKRATAEVRGAFGGVEPACRGDKPEKRLTRRSLLRRVRLLNETKGNTGRSISGGSSHASRPRWRAGPTAGCVT